LVNSANLEQAKAIGVNRLLFHLILAY